MLVNLKLIEQREAVRGIANNQDAPPFADLLEAASNRTGHVAEAFTLHRSNVDLVTIAVQVTGRSIHTR